ncbi:hypothetical protein C5E06_02725 [Pseudoclavibacter sp. RFBI5]|nr:hypothetical protein C5E06_02725 [Pseudoclavibacter sp. RFBI5]
MAVPGLYIVATTADARAEHTETSGPTINSTAIAELLQRHPSAAIDARPADPSSMAQRLEQMRPAGEPALYIGRANSSVLRRMAQFYSTEIGARQPHGGGWPIKMLGEDTLWVHYGTASDPKTAEVKMVEHFIDSLPADARSALIDPALPLPFANLEFPKDAPSARRGQVKKHGLRYVKDGKTVAASSRNAVPHLPAVRVDSPTPGREPGSVSTQNVTAVDLRTGQLRFARAAKRLFPSARAAVTVRLGNECITASWNPRSDETRERSGVLRLRSELLTRHCAAGRPVRVSLLEDQTYRVHDLGGNG